MKGKRQRGFTFSELLIVIPCVILALAVLFPSIQKAKERAKEARCRNNIRNLGMAVMLFIIDHHERYPTAGKCGRDLEDDWTWGGNIIALPQADPDKCERVRVEEGALWPFVTGYPRVGRYGDGKALFDKWYASPRTNPYLCPSAGPVGEKRGLSYSMNCRLEVRDEKNALTGIKITKLKNPSRTVLFVDESDSTLNDGYFDPTGEENKSPELHLKHRNGGNVAFCDGHVEWIEKEKFLKVMDPKGLWFSPPASVAPSDPVKP
jgi:prepilin-type processing-associated H-X9-DG protein